MFPIPKHLKKIIKPIGKNNSEFQLNGKLECNCGSEKFVIRLVGDDSEYKNHQVIRVTEINGDFFLIIKGYCKNCNSEHLIFDNDYHGWNGFVCGGDNKEAPRPSSKDWNCDKCANDEHRIELNIASQGKEDFVDEGGEEFGEENWAEGFSWITMKTECLNCNKSNPEWISYETMQ